MLLLDEFNARGAIHSLRLRRNYEYSLRAFLYMMAHQDANFFSLGKLNSHAINCHDSSMLGDDRTATVNQMRELDEAFEPFEFLTRTAHKRELEGDSFMHHSYCPHQNRVFYVLDRSTHEYGQTLQELIGMVADASGLRRCEPYI